MDEPSPKIAAPIKARRKPMLFSDIGRVARNILHHDYDVVRSVVFNCVTPAGVGLSFTGSKKIGEDVGLLDVSACLNHRNITGGVNVNTRNDFVCYGAFEKLPSWKLTCVADNTFCGKFEVQYLNDNIGITGGVDVVSPCLYPLARGSFILKSDDVSLGGEMSFDTSSKEMRSLSVGTSFGSERLSVAILMNGIAKTLTASCYEVTDENSNTAVGFEATHDFSTKENNASIGAIRSFTDSTTLKSRVDLKGTCCALIEHKWHKNSLVTVSGLFDPKIEGMKVGCKFHFNPVEKGGRQGLALVLGDS